MIVEIRRFVQVGADYFNHNPRRKEDLDFEPITIDTRYISRCYRDPVGEFQMTTIFMVDHPTPFRADVTYEQVREWMHQSNPTQYTSSLRTPMD